MTAPTVAEPRPALLLEFSGTATVEAEVDPVAFFAAMSTLERPYYLRWKPEEDEYWGEDTPAWLKPYAYLVARFIEDVEVCAPTGRGFRDNSDFEHREDRVRERAGTRLYDRQVGRWTSGDYQVLLAAVPWLAAADTPAAAEDMAAAAPMPGDQPLFDLGQPTADGAVPR